MISFSEIQILDESVVRMSTERSAMQEKKADLTQSLSRCDLVVNNLTRDLQRHQSELRDLSSSSSNGDSLRIKRFGGEIAVQLAEKIKKEKYNNFRSFCHLDEVCACYPYLGLFSRCSALLAYI